MAPKKSTSTKPKKSSNSSQSRNVKVPPNQESREGIPSQQQSNQDVSPQKQIKLPELEEGVEAISITPGDIEELEGNAFRITNSEPLNLIVDGMTSSYVSLAGNQFETLTGASGETINTTSPTRDTFDEINKRTDSSDSDDENVPCDENDPRYAAASDLAWGAITMAFKLGNSAKSGTFKEGHVVGIIPSYKGCHCCFPAGERASGKNKSGEGASGGDGASGGEWAAGGASGGGEASEGSSVGEAADGASGGGGAAGETSAGASDIGASYYDGACDEASGGISDGEKASSGEKASGAASLFPIFFKDKCDDEIINSMQRTYEKLTPKFKEIYAKIHKHSLLVLPQINAAPCAYAKWSVEFRRNFVIHRFFMTVKRRMETTAQQATLARGHSDETQVTSDGISRGRRLHGLKGESVGYNSELDLNFESFEGELYDYKYEILDEDLLRVIYTGCLTRGMEIKTFSEGEKKELLCCIKKYETKLYIYLRYMVHSRPVGGDQKLMTRGMEVICKKFRKLIALYYGNMLPEYRGGSKTLSNYTKFVPLKLKRDLLSRQKIILEATVNLENRHQVTANILFERALDFLCLEYRKIMDSFTVVGGIPTHRRLGRV